MLKTSTLLHRSKPLLWKASLLAGAGFLALAVGCNRDQVSHFRVPKEAVADHPDHPGHAEEGMPQGMPQGSNLPEPPRPAGQGSLKWSLPKGWSEVPGEGMRFATFKPPVPGKIDGSVVVLPGPAGGELANVNRWRNQIGLPPLDEGALSGARKTIATKAGPLNVYDFTNDAKPASRVVAGLAQIQGNTWFVKLTGDADAVAAARKDFMQLLGSLRLDESR